MYLCPNVKILEIKEGFLSFAAGEMPPVFTVKSKELFHKESYRIIVDQKGVTLEGCDDAGLYYARLTLSQLMLNYRGKLPFMYIYDEPEFSFRGFMIDSCRHFFTISEIKKIIDAAAFFKFNKFHFHLSDDQGFRMEIESYPLLTTVGSVRKGSDFHGEKDTKPYGGYYTKSELRELVDYCRERFIEIIPEFDFPGHTSSVLSAYPNLSCKGEPVESKITRGIFPDILCAGNPESMELVFSVLDEICQVFPSEYIHIGGDEAPKTRWNNCEKCKGELRRLGLLNMEQLQTHITNTAAEYLKKKGRKAICWNEAIAGGNAQRDNLTVARWMDKGESSVQWANGGNPWICESFTPYYADYPYGMHPLKSVFNYNPRKIKGLNSLGANSLAGIETPIWTEHILTFEKMAYMCFPRWLAVAETAWNGAQKEKYGTFLKNAEFFCNHLLSMGIKSAPRKDWDVLPHKRLGQAVGFFGKSLKLRDVKQFFGMETE